MPLLGHIATTDRTPSQHRASAVAKASIHPLAHYGLPMRDLKPGEGVMLYKFWTEKKVITDVGMSFDRIHQLTGSCVWAGGTNALFSTIAAQRMAGTGTTKAFLPFTLHNYAMSRHYMGDDSQGEGSMGSTFAKSLNEDGVVEWKNDGSNGMPKWTDEDGISCTSRDEMQWSSVRNPGVQTIIAQSKTHLLGSAAVCHTPADILAGLQNGYAASFACNNYIGKASVQGSGDKAVVLGKWDGRGGHQQSVHGAYKHPDLGMIYWAQNNWPGSTYPRDPFGGPVCGCWVLEKDVAYAMQNLDAEVYSLSHLNWFPAAPDLLDYFM